MVLCTMFSILLAYVSMRKIIFNGGQVEFQLIVQAFVRGNNESKLWEPGRNSNITTPRKRHPWDIYPSHLDYRKYKFYVLRENKLRVLLISDPKANTSAASMSVGAGFFDDPPSHEGLAHLCEHTISMGSQKHPDINTFEKFVRAYGGSKNAVTQMEETLFQFEISSPYMPMALDIFAQLFITPLFRNNLLKSEVNVLHQEYLANLHTVQYKVTRLLQLISNVEHPYHQFSVGDYVTLNKDDLRFQLINFFQYKYSSRNVS